MLIDNAMALVTVLARTPVTPQARRATLQRGAAIYAERGWTGVHNMSVSCSDVEALEGLAREGALTIAVYNAVAPECAVDTILRDGARAEGLATTRALKIYMDGALGSRGAWLLDPYADAEGVGLALLDRERALSIMHDALEQDVQIALHAIGDRANRLALDWMQEALAQAPADADPRWRIEHAQIVNPDDIDRFAALGIIASMQPSHAIGDLHFAPARLGDDRLDGAYAWRSLIDSGAIIAGGSDAPVEVGSPVIEFYAAVARRDLNGFQGDNWRPEQAVSRDEALKMLTLWPAFTAFQDDEVGTIEVGKRANLTAFSADLMTIPLEAIPNQRAVLTVVEGRVVFSDLGGATNPQDQP